MIIITGAPSVRDRHRSRAPRCLGLPCQARAPERSGQGGTLALRHKQLSDEKDRCRSNVEAIFRSVKDGIVTVDEQMRVVDVNQAALRSLRFRPRRCARRIHPRGDRRCGGACVDVLKETLATRKAVEIRHIECHRKNMRKQIVSVSAAPLMDHMDNFSGCVMVLRDETRLHDLERSVGRARHSTV